MEGVWQIGESPYVLRTEDTVAPTANVEHYSFIFWVWEEVFSFLKFGVTITNLNNLKLWESYQLDSLQNPSHRFLRLAGIVRR